MISFSLPLKTPSLTNQRLHWAVKAKQAKAQRSAAMLKCPKWSEGPLLEVRMTRYGVRELDTGNLPAALKSIQDGIASRLGVDDGSRLVRWIYGQATCAKGAERVDVEVRALPQSVAYLPRQPRSPEC